MSIEAMKLALEALEYDTRPDTEYGINTAIEALRAAIEQAEKQEPVAWKDAPQRIYLQVCGHDVCEVPFSEHDEISWCEDKINDSDIPYVRADTAPPQREWVGLTDEEAENFVQAVWPREATTKDFIRAIEAKLKEKNG